MPWITRKFAKADRDVAKSFSDRLEPDTL